MNPFIALMVEIALTLLATLLITRYLHPHLKRVLVELCGTDNRAEFWAAFANILLIGLPLIIALGFRPDATMLEESAFEILGRFSGSLAGYLLALAGIGIIVSTFALVAPRTTPQAK